MSNVKNRDVRVGCLCNSFGHDASVLVEQILIAGALLIEIREVDCRVHKLASLAVDAIALLVSSASCHTVLAGDVRLLLQLVLTVGESTVFSKLTDTTLLPELAKLGLLLLLVGGLAVVMVMLAVMVLALVIRHRNERRHKLG